MSGSIHHSAYTYIFKLNKKEAGKISNSTAEKIKDGYFHSLVDSFSSTQDEPILPPGNYLFVSAKDNKIVYEPHAIGDLEIKIINDDRDNYVFVHTKQGSLINDAIVVAGKSQLRFNNAVKAYGPVKRKKILSIYVDYKDVLYSFPISLGRPWKTLFFRKLAYSTPLKYVALPIRKIFKRPYYNRSFSDGTTPYEFKFKGFIVFSKPRYKPGDTVQLKAFVETNKGGLVKKPMLLRLSDHYLRTDTILAKLYPYAPGGYTYQFVLTDSLNLDLDEDYLITLEDTRSRKYDLDNYTGNLEDDEYASKRKVLVRGKFSYEDYELKQTTVNARSNKKEHNRGEEISLFLKATDENQMPIMDERVRVVVKTEVYGSKEFHGLKVFLPDTLWIHEQSLENLGETKIVLPDSIFPKASFNYEIICDFLNSNNELQTKTLSQHFEDKDNSITFDLANDSLLINHLVQGKTVPVSANLYVFDQKEDTIEQYKVFIPGVFKVNPFAVSYEVEADSLDEIYKLKQTKGMVSCVSSRAKDSVAIQLVNPNHLPVWYTLFAGKRVILRGFGDSLLFLEKVRTAKNYFVSLQYVYSNRIYKENYTIPFQERLLTIKVDQPGVVYPGQTTSIGIKVTDSGGQPVEGADITAYAYTTKFHAQVPFVPYLGKRYPLRMRRNGFELNSTKELEQSVHLNWDRWSREMHLDTIEYYKFLHPNGIYKNQEPAPDSITQVAPFVVIKGDLQPIQLFYIDEVPVFFNQVQQLQWYSFKVSEGKHSFRIRTQDQMIRLDSVCITKGVKTFISIEADTSNKKIRIEKMPDTLTDYEKGLWNKYLIVFANNFGENLAYIKQSDNYFLLNNNNNSNYQNNILAGPFAGTYAKLVVKNKFQQDFETEGAWQYTITQGLIKQKQYDNHYPFHSWLSSQSPVYNFHDFVLTEKQIDSLWQAYLDMRSANTELFKNANSNKEDDGRLQLGLSKALAKSNLFIKNIILFQYDNPDFTRVYPGGRRDLGFIPAGNYRLMFLLKKDHYFIKDSLTVRTGGINFFEVGGPKELPADSISLKISRIIESREKNTRANMGEDLNMIKETFNDRYLDPSALHLLISGVVNDSRGGPIVGASITVKGTRIGTVTNGKGEFNINTTVHGTLVIASIGFSAREMPIKPNNFYNIVLTPSENHLEEVVVTGYGIVRRQELTGAVSSVSSNDILMGKVPGIMIRGSASIEADKQPLIIVDGLPYSGKLEDLDTSRISGVNILRTEDAKAIYGLMAAGGAIIVTTKQMQGHTLSEQPLPGNSLRHNFKDNAWWQPKLVSDKNGFASFNVAFPDDITNWQTFVIAMGNKKQTGFAEGSIKAFKAISANIALPQFAIVGDSLSVIGKALNYLPGNIQVTRSFSINELPVKEDILSLHNSLIDTFSIVAPSKDSLKLTYSIRKENGYFDGEERVIPIFKPGVLETNGVFGALDRDTTFQLHFNTDTTVIKIYAEASLLSVLFEETERLRTYEYLCNEQLASKLKAMLVQKKIDQFLNRPFKGEDNIRELINKLNQSRSTAGLWGWWPGNEPSTWISLHVIEALVAAKQAGYTVSINNSVLTDYLIYNLESYQPMDKISGLFLLKQLGAKPDFKKYIDSIEKKEKNLSLYDSLRLTELKQLVGITIVLDSLISKVKHTVFGNIYWGENNYKFFDNSIQNTLCVYRILRKEGNHDKELRKIRNYFLEKRSSGHWRNTYESSLILETILPELLEEQANSSPLSLSIQGKDSFTVTKFPFSTTLANSSSINVVKIGTAPLYFTAYQQAWNAIPGKVDGNFIVNSSFLKNGKIVSQLKAGNPVILQEKVVVKADAEYVLIEVPIPAGCSYEEKRQSYLNGEVHREYFKNKVSIFCRSLKIGEYTFTISLVPRYNGVYILNPSKAEMMYFPVFYGREAMRKVKID